MRWDQVVMGAPVIAIGVSFSSIADVLDAGQVIGDWWPAVIVAFGLVASPSDRLAPGIGAARRPSACSSSSSRRTCSTRGGGRCHRDHGGVDLIIPRDWRVTVRGTPILGGRQQSRGGILTPRRRTPTPCRRARHPRRRRDRRTTSSGQRRSHDGARTHPRSPATGEDPAADVKMHGGNLPRRPDRRLVRSRGGSGLVRVRSTHRVLLPGQGDRPSRPRRPTCRRPRVATPAGHRSGIGDLIV